MVSRLLKFLKQTSQVYILKTYNVLKHFFLKKSPFNDTNFFLHKFCIKCAILCLDTVFFMFLCEKKKAKNFKPKHVL